MIDIEKLRANPELFRQSVKNRNYDPKIIDEFLQLDQKWRELLASVEKLRADQKKLGANFMKIAAPAGGEPRPFSDGREEAKSLKEKIVGSEKELEVIAVKRTAILRRIPNLTQEGVPVGKDDTQNVTLREVGKKPAFGFQPKDYITLSEPLGIIDTERAAKVSGTRFSYLLGGAARLEFALAQFAFETLSNTKIISKLIRQNKLNLSDTAFTPVIPPVMIKKEMMEGMGYVERGGEEIYLLEKDNLYLVATSEQSIGPMHAQETFEEKTLPRRYIGFSTCFRREAGSYGKDTKGILRVHQFNKLEMFSVVNAESSRDEHRLFLALEEYLMQELKLPYRVLDICTGDLGDPAAAKYDIEAWLPGQRDGQGEYRETHSTSNTTDFQSRRLGIRYKTMDDKKKPIVKLAHLVNGTVFSERPIIAIIENYQTAKGTVKVPNVLRPWVGMKEIC